MQPYQSISSQYPQVTQLLGFGVLSALAAIQLTLADRSADLSLLGVSMLFWTAALYLLWEKRNRLSWNSSFVASLLGLLLVAFVLLRSWVVVGYDPIIRAFPLLSVLGVSLLISGFSGFRAYWQQILIFSFLVPSPGALSILADISVFTAQFSTALLWLCGFPARRQGVSIHLLTSGVDVYPGCSGIDSIFYLIGLAILFVLMFPTTTRQKIAVPLVAVVIGFVVNSIRVSLMTILTAFSTPEALHYWHKGSGSLLFSMLAVAIFGCFCFFLVCQSDSYSYDAEKS